jgi:predicted nucleic acid-binding protein
MRVNLPARRVYWDSCVFIGLLTGDPTLFAACEEIWEEGKRGDTIICTSFWTYAEVFKVKCEVQKPLAEANDKRIEVMLAQRWLRTAVVDERIGTLARRLLRMHTECSKPSDGIHLATAIRLNVDEMHTFDKNDLLKLDGKVLREDGVPLVICKPKVIPLPPPPPVIVPKGPILPQFDFGAPSVS